MRANGKIARKAGRGARNAPNEVILTDGACGISPLNCVGRIWYSYGWPRKGYHVPTLFWADCIRTDGHLRTGNDSLSAPPQCKPIEIAFPRSKSRAPGELLTRLAKRNPDPFVEEGGRRGDFREGEDG